METGMNRFDFNGDRSVDLSDAVAHLTWQFLGGRPHVLGITCTSLPGCSEAPGCR
jgi:hypothetical protein